MFHTKKFILQKNLALYSMHVSYYTYVHSYIYLCIYAYACMISNITSGILKNWNCWNVLHRFSMMTVANLLTEIEEREMMQMFILEDIF